MSMSVPHDEINEELTADRQKGQSGDTGPTQPILEKDDEIMHVLTQASDNIHWELDSPIIYFVSPHFQYKLRYDSPFFQTYKNLHSSF